MSEVVFNSVITGTFSVIGIMISALITNSIVRYRVEQLEKKVEKHNDLLSRVYKLEQKIEDMKS